MSEPSESDASNSLGDRKDQGRLSRARRALFAGLFALPVLVGFVWSSWRVAPNTVVAGVQVGGMTRSQAREAVWDWMHETMEGEGGEAFIVGPTGMMSLEPLHCSELGLVPDVDATVGRLPFTAFGLFQRGGETRKITAVFREYETPKLDLAEIEAQVLPQVRPARVTMSESGEIVREQEIPVMEVDWPSTKKSFKKAVSWGGQATLVVKEETRRVTNEDLQKIVNVVSEFSTKFNRWDKPRSQNLKVAAEKIDGYVLLPGEKFSFNEVVGERSAENGFNLAGVYRRGRHAIDIGGGVCQVSTTLFNAAMLANLKKNYRANHTFAVPYVPVGRDAAVAYGLQDMQFTNTTDGPTAVSATWEPGLLTFRILGRKDPTERVEITQVITAVIEHPVTYVDDPTLPRGEEKEVEKGGKGFRAITRRVVYRGDEIISDEVLMKSHYKGGPKIVHRGPEVVPSLE